MSPEDVDSSQPISDAEAQANALEIAKWTAEQNAFQQHPKSAEFYRRLYRRIAVVVDPGEKDWEKLTSTNKFQKAFDVISDRMLTVKGFRNVTEKYEEYVASHSDDAKPALTKWEYMINRVSLILAEWRSSRSNRSTRKESPDEHIESAATSQPSRDVFPLKILSQRIDTLKLQHRATLILWIWPIQEFPDVWREKYLPVIQEAGVARGLTNDEVKLRLEKVMGERQFVSERELLEKETRRGSHFESERHFDCQKRVYFGHLRRLEESGEFTTDVGVEALLQHSCYEAVKLTTEASVMARFTSEDLYERSAIGIRKVCNPNWFRQSFCHSCYKQKFHRRSRLNASVELLNMKPENGPMSHAEIGIILNCPENTSYSNLSRARAALLEGGDDDNLEDALERAAKDNAKDREAEFKQELTESRLNAFVCEDLKPTAG